MELLSFDKIIEILGDQSNYLLHHSCKISSKLLELPGYDFVEKNFGDSNRNPQTLRNLQLLYNTGNLKGTGYLSILPVDQGVEHSAGVSFDVNRLYFNPENIVKLALSAGCNAVASTLGILAFCSRKYAHKIPFIVKLNHNEALSYPLKYDQVYFGSAKEAWNLGAAGVGSTIYFGSDESKRQIQETRTVFEQAHELGMFTVLWCYLRNENFKSKDNDYHLSADLTGQANYLGVTLEADLIKQKQPEINRGFENVGFDNKLFSQEMYKLYSDHPIDLCRYQVLNCFAGKIGLINSGGYAGKNDLEKAVQTAVINKRAGGQGLIVGRKAFKKSFEEGVELLNTIQSVYLCNEISIA